MKLYRIKQLGKILRNYNSKPKESEEYGVITEDVLQKHFQYISEEIKKVNYEQYMLGRYLTEEYRKAFYTIHYLYYELNKCKVKEYNISILKLNWWKENIKQSITGIPPDTPVLICLSYLSKKYELKESQFRQILKWKEVELKWSQPPTIQILENYSEGTYSQLLYIMQYIMKIKDVKADHILSHTGKCFGIVNTLRGSFYLANYRNTFIPADICAKYNVTEEFIYEKRNSKELENAIFDLADYAKSHLDHIKKMEYPNDVFGLLMLSVLSKTILNRMLKNNFNIMLDDTYTKDALLASFSWNLIKSNFTKKLLL